MKYAQFRAQGRLGCPRDYEVFRGLLEPLLDRIHRQTRHVGKSPARRRRHVSRAELTALRSQLRAATEAERYEEAARLRDLIRERESQDES
jgi:protein arginine kinase activator